MPRERDTINMPEKERKGVGNYSSEVRNPSVILLCYFKLFTFFIKYFN